MTDWLTDWLCWVFVSVQGLSLVAASGDHSSSRCAGLSLSRPLLLRSTGSRRAGSAIVAHGPSRSAACGILPDWGSNPRPLHWQADSQALRHQGSPALLLSRAISLMVAKWSPMAIRVHASLFTNSRRKDEKSLLQAQNIHSSLCYWPILGHMPISGPIIIVRKMLCSLGFIDQGFRKWGGCLDNTGILPERIKRRDGTG